MKRLKHYNIHGAWDNKGFGARDLEGPLYHNEGRLMHTRWTGPKHGTLKLTGLQDIQELCVYLEETANKLRHAQSLGATHVNWGDREIDGQALFNPTVLDVDDQAKAYREFKRAFREEHGRNPTREELRGD